MPKYKSPPIRTPWGALSDTLSKALNGEISLVIDCLEDWLSRHGDHPLEHSIAGVIMWWDALDSRDRAFVVWERVCRDFGIGQAEFLSIVIEGAAAMNLDAVRLAQAVAAPRVMKKLTEMAQTDEGVKDRELFLKTSGLLKEGSGVTINNNITNQTVALPGVNFSSLMQGIDRSVRGERLLTEGDTSEERNIIEGDVIEGELPGKD